MSAYKTKFQFNCTNLYISKYTSQHCLGNFKTLCIALYAMLENHQSITASYIFVFLPILSYITLCNYLCNNMADSSVLSLLQKHLHTSV